MILKFKQIVVEYFIDHIHTYVKRKKKESISSEY